MTKLITAIAVIGLSLGAASAQVNSGVAGSPPKDFLTKGTLAKGRERIVGRNDQAGNRDEQHSEDSAIITLVLDAQKSLARADRRDAA